MWDVGTVFPLLTVQQPGLPPFFVREAGDFFLWCGRRIGRSRPPRFLFLVLVFPIGSLPFPDEIDFKLPAE